MITKDTKKIKIFIFAFAILSLLLFFIPVQQKTKKEIISLERNYTFQEPDYRVLEKKNHLIIETLGITFEIPKDWEVERYKEDLSRGLDISAPLCSFYISSYKEENEIRYLKASINSFIRDEIKRESVNVIEVDNFYAIKKGETGPVKIPYRDYIYEIGTSSLKEDCYEDYYELISSIYFLDKNEE